jgi:hypothetical protein
MRGEYIGLMYQVHNGVVGHALFWMSNEEFINCTFTVPLWFWFSRVIQTHFGLRVCLIIAVDVSNFTKKEKLTQ